ncbi:MAG: hypothetical protein PHF25_03305 [Candidatus Margulisbacteria bacterium]|nr:hypothetical protein [Candidatus Margulisiibacteriota bacterium]
MNIYKLDFWQTTKLIFSVSFILILPFLLIPMLLVGLDDLVNKGRRRR